LHQLIAFVEQAVGTAAGACRHDLLVERSDLRGEVVDAGDSTADLLIHGRRLLGQLLAQRVVNGGKRRCATERSLSHGR
jgi:hypothetical protein